MSLFQSDGFLDKLTRVELKKHFQKKKIVRALYLSGPMALADIMKSLSVSAPTIQNLLDELLNEDIIHIPGSGSSKGGRRPNLYGLQKNAFYVLSIDIDNYSTHMALFDSSNKKGRRYKELKLELKNELSVVNQIYEAANKLIKDSGVDEGHILGVGVDMPGLIESEEGINHTILNFEKPVRDLFAGLFKKPVVIENDAKAKALAEFRFGKAIGKQNVLVLHLGWGIGMGMILNGKPYKGARGFSGEFSHIPMTDERGYLCSCGKRGCLETVASGAALTRLAVKAIGKQNVLVLHLGWGIGMGMILNGKPYNGARGFSGESSHIPMTDERGYLCSCGKRGCLETVASGAALTRLAVEAIEKGEMTLISEMAYKKTKNITLELILKAAQKGDQFAISILSKIGFELGKGISSLMQILNPEMIILGGPLANAGSYLITSIEQAMQQYAFAIMREKMELTVSDLGDNASLLGNVINVMESLFES